MERRGIQAGQHHQPHLDDKDAVGDQIARLRDFRARRDPIAVKNALERLRRACRGTENTMPHILRAVQDRVSMGEICDVFREVWGEYREPAYF